MSDLALVYSYVYNKHKVKIRSADRFSLTTQIRSQIGLWFVGPPSGRPTLSKPRFTTKSEYIWKDTTKIKRNLPDWESNPGLPRL